MVMTKKNFVINCCDSFYILTKIKGETKNLFKILFLLRIRTLMAIKNTLKFIQWLHTLRILLNRIAIKINAIQQKQ